MDTLDPSRLLVIGLAGPELTRDDRRFLAEIQPAGVILFSRNIVSPEQTAALVAEVKASVRPAPLVMIDQEGGPVDRLRPLVPSAPAAMALGAADDAKLTRETARLTATLLALLGVDVDLAPVVDLALSPAENAIGLRSFGFEVARVRVHAAAYLDGLEAAGVLGCVKHFPGLGTSDLDSHRSLPVISIKRRALDKGELKLYAELSPRAGAVLVSHGYYPDLSRRGIAPASLSPEVVQFLLKDELGFQGVVLSDDLCMGAVAMEDIGRAAVLALAAGVDLPLVCEGAQNIARCAEALAAAAAKDELSEERQADAWKRLRSWRMRARRVARAAGRGGFDAAAFARAAESLEALALKVARKAATTVHAGATIARGARVLILRPKLRWLDQEAARRGGSPLVTALESRGHEVEERVYAQDDPDAILAALEASGFDAVILATYNARAKPRTQALAARLATATPVHHLTLGWPGDLPPALVSASAASFGCTYEGVRTAVSALAGGLRPRGALPVPRALFES